MEGSATSGLTFTLQWIETRPRPGRVLERVGPSLGDTRNMIGRVALRLQNIGPSRSDGLNPLGLGSLDLFVERVGSYPQTRPDPPDPISDRDPLLIVSLILDNCEDIAILIWITRTSKYINFFDHLCSLYTLWYLYGLPFSLLSLIDGILSDNYNLDQRIKY